MPPKRVVSWRSPGGSRRYVTVDTPVQASILRTELVSLGCSGVLVRRSRS